jgi:hypothetical protein
LDSRLSRVANIVALPVERAVNVKKKTPSFEFPARELEKLGDRFLERKGEAEQEYEARVVY